VNAIAPGMFRTRITEAILQRAESFIAGTTPAVLFLASEGASYIMGQVVAIDGGRSAQ
jgi:NAD(P)-dependent dehydrogenase (short-subunit alcohol dehydrogenase family)